MDQHRLGPARWPRRWHYWLANVKLRSLALRENRLGLSGRRVRLDRWFLRFTRAFPILVFGPHLLY